MKTYALLAFLLSTTVVSTSRGQGTVYFANNNATAITNYDTGQRASPSQFKASLFYLPWDPNAPQTPDPWYALLNPEFRNVATTTLWAPGLFHNGGVPVRVEEITPPGGLGWFQVRAWEFAYGDTWEQMLQSPPIGGRFAVALFSNVILVDTGDPTTIPAGTPSSLVDYGLSRFYPIIPEPSVIVLELAALSALWAFRRRQ